MSARHGGGIQVIAELVDDAPGAAQRFEIVDDLGTLPVDAARFDAEACQVLFRELKPGDHGPTGQPPRTVDVPAYRRYFGVPAALPDKSLFTKLGEAMRVDDDDEELSEIPVGYTYLGQFIFHDLSRLKSQPKSPRDPRNLRSALLDLDSVFGDVGPGTVAPCGSTPTPMALGCTSDGRPLDLPRDSTGRPLIADERNDDLLPLAQIHMAVIRFYNAVFAVVRNETEAKAKAKELCQLHFQSIVLHDYLPRIIDDEVYRDVIAHGRAVIHTEAEKIAQPGLAFLLPLEFTTACARFGHSMVRFRYANWNPSHSAAQVYGFWTATFNNGDAVGGHVPITQLPANWVTQWDRLFSLEQTPAGAGAAGHGPPLMAARIDTRLAVPMTAIPPQAQPPPDPPGTALSGNAAVRSLERAHLLRLNSGQEVVRQINDKLPSGRPQIVPLTQAELLSDESSEVAAVMTDPSYGAANTLLDNTPLWFYTLKEAMVRHGGRKLGPLAGRIVMETVHAAIAEAEPSIIKNPAWGPDARLNPSRQGRYTFPDLIRFAGLA
jgi:hypothetical protein